MTCWEFSDLDLFQAVLQAGGADLRYVDWVDYIHRMVQPTCGGNVMPRIYCADTNEGARGAVGVVVNPFHTEVESAVSPVWILKILPQKALPALCRPLPQPISSKSEGQQQRLRNILHFLKSLSEKFARPKVLFVSQEWIPHVILAWVSLWFIRPGYSDRPGQISHVYVTMPVGAKGLSVVLNVNPNFFGDELWEPTRNGSILKRNSILFLCQKNQKCSSKIRWEKIPLRKYFRKNPIFWKIFDFFENVFEWDFFLSEFSTNFCFFLQMESIEFVLKMRRFRVDSYNSSPRKLGACLRTTVKL